MEEFSAPIDGETMEENTLPKLLVSREEAKKMIQEQIDKGQQLYNQQIDSKEELDKTKADFNNWSNYNETLLSKLFSNSSIALKYSFHIFGRSTNFSLISDIERHQEDLSEMISRLQGICGRLELYGEPSETLSNTSTVKGTHIFIGHGHSTIWRELKEFISERLGLPYDEFNRVSTAGIGTKERLKGMLDQSCMAFLLLTAEDEQTDGTLHARENVIHEAGLFQGRLGFEKAIILLEEGCEEFSNIHGLGQIRFPKGNIKAAFEEIRQVLERERVI